MNFLYLFIALRYPGRVKIGISERPRGRRKEVAYALRSYTVGPYVPMVFARRIERALHTVYRPLKAQMPDHAGASEWVWIVNPLTMFFVGLVLWVNDSVGHIVYLPLIALIFPLPFDVAICIGLYWVFQVFLLSHLLPILATGTNLIWLHLKYWFISLLG